MTDAHKMLIHRHKKLKYLFIYLGIITLLLRYFLTLSAIFTEQAYSRILFGAVRLILDNSFGILPIPGIYLLLLILLLFQVKNVWFYRQTIEKKYLKMTLPPKTRYKEKLFSVAAFLGALIFLFHFLWAFNYQRQAIEIQLKIKAEALDFHQVNEEAGLALEQMKRARRGIPRDRLILPQDLEEILVNRIKKVLQSMGYPARGKVKTRKIVPAGLLLRLGISGFYFPFTGEAYLSSALTPVEIPFSMAHEIAHGYGFTEEGTANFLAYLACIGADDQFIRYSGWFEYFNYVAREVYRFSPAAHRKLLRKIPLNIMGDRIKINRNLKKYRTWLTSVGHRVNDIYLKTQGIKSGISSYNRMVVLAAAWRKR